MRPSVVLWGPLQVAVIATAITAMAYVVVAGAVLWGFFQVGLHQVDGDLQNRMEQVREGRVAMLQPTSFGGFVLAWQVDPNGDVVSVTRGVPDLGRQSIPLDRPFTLTAFNEPLRMYASQADGFGVVVLGTDIQALYHETVLIGLGEVAIAIPILGAIFLVSFWSGRRSAVPVEQARNRQLAFTADASHELRTPLQVIEAETSLALLKDRPAESYRQTVERVAQEGRRLRAIVDDLLWLARFEHEPSVPERKLIDLHAIAATARERFEAVASGKGLTLEVVPASGQAPLIVGPPEWIERLAGVLVDNACRYTPEGGRIRIATALRDGRSWLTVEDSGPGIPGDKLARVFDRFHRASNVPGGAGLGLSIADGIVRVTGGHWRVGASPQLGGACFEVSWPPARAARGTAGEAAAVPPPPSAPPPPVPMG